MGAKSHDPARVTGGRLDVSAVDVLVSYSLYYAANERLLLLLLLLLWFIITIISVPVVMRWLLMLRCRVHNNQLEAASEPLQFVRNLHSSTHID